MKKKMWTAFGFCAVITVMIVYPRVAQSFPTTYQIDNFTSESISGLSPWIFDTIDAADGVGEYVSIAFDLENHPYISYYDSIYGDLKMAKYVVVGGNCGTRNDWECETVDSIGNVGMYSSIIIDPLDNLPIISYYDATNRALKLAIDTAVGWAIKTIDAPLLNSTGLYSSLAMDSNRGLHIAYYYSNFSGVDSLRYAKHVGSLSGNCTNLDYQCEIIDSGDRVGKYASIATGSNDQPRIAYYDEGNDALMYAFSTNDSWTIREILPNQSGQYASLVVDTNNGDVPQIASFDSTNNTLEYAKYVDSGGNCGFNSSATQFEWQCDVIESLGTAEAPRGISLELDSDHFPMITYQSGENIIKVARPVNAIGQLIGNCGPEESLFYSWQCDIISAGIGYEQGDYISHSVSSSGLTTIAYYGNIPSLPGNLRIAYQRFQVYLPLCQTD